MAYGRTVRLVVLMLACMAGMAACSSGEASSGGEFQQVDMSQLPPAEHMIKAAAVGDVDTLNDLLASNPTLLHVQGPNGNTPLHAAAVNGQNKAVKLLLEAGANPSLANEDGHTASALAAQYDHLDTAKLIAAAMMAGGSNATDAGAR